MGEMRPERPQSTLNTNGGERKQTTRKTAQAEMKKLLLCWHGIDDRGVLR
jgi:hypothetical protein